MGLELEATIRYGMPILRSEEADNTVRCSFHFDLPCLQTASTFSVVHDGNWQRPAAVVSWLPIAIDCVLS
jgi:hypothetical protein